MRPLLTSETFNGWVLLEMLFDDLITLDILMELLITKLVSGTNLIDRGVSHEIGDLL